VIREVEAVDSDEGREIYTLVTGEEEAKGQ
jgi:hypothetical protein